MSWSLLAAKAFGDARRDHTLHYVVVLLAAVGAGLGRGYAVVAGSTPGVAPPPLSAFAPLLLGVLTPLLTLTLAYDVVPAERRSGRIRLLLSLPHTRRDLVVGTALGRFGVVAAALAAVVFAQAAVAALLGAPVSALDVASYLLVTLCYAAALLGAVVALSTLTESGPLSLALGTVVTVVAITWRGLFPMTWRALVGTVPPSWLDSVATLGPLDVYVDAVPLTAGGDPGGLAVLVVWALLWLAVGVAAFRRVDL